MAETVERLVVQISLKGIASAIAELEAIDAAIDKVDRDDVNVDVEVRGTAKALGELKALDKAADRVDRKVNIRADVDRAKAKQSTKLLGEIKERLDGIGKIAKTISMAGGLAKMLKLGLFASIAQPAIAALTALGVALVGLVGSLGKVAGSLAALPGLLSAVVQAAVVAKIALGGVFEAIGAGFASQQPKSFGGGGGGYQPTQREKDRAIEDAQIRVENANRNLEDAEEALLTAQENVKDSQEEVNQAREDAVEILEDYKLALDNLTLSEREAEAAVEDAERYLGAVMADPGATERDKRDAVLALARAEQELINIQAQKADVQEEVTTRSDAGVEGSPEVLGALENVSYWQDAAADAAWRLELAQIEQRRALEDLEDPLKNLVGSGGGGGGLLTQYNDALSKLSPAAQEFVKTVVGMKPQLDQIKQNVQEAFFPGATTFLEGFQSLLPLIDKHATATAGVLGELAADFGEWFKTPDFQADFDILGNMNVEIIRSLGDALFAVSQGLVDFMIAAEPFTMWVVDDVIGGAAERFRDWAEAGRESGSIAEGLDSVREAMELWGDVLGSIWDWFKEIVIAAEPLTTWILEGIRDAADSSTEWMQSAEGAERMAEFFENMKPNLSALATLFGEIGRSMGRIAETNSLETFVDAFVNQLLPALEEMIIVFGESGTMESFIALLTDLVGVFTTLGESGILGSIIDAVGLLFSGFNQLGESGVGTHILAAVAAFVALKSVIGVARVALKLFLGIKVPPANPILLAIMALVVAGWLIYKNWDKIWPHIQKVIEAVWDWLEPVLNDMWELLKDVGDFFVEAWDTAVDAVKAAWEYIKPTIEDLIDIFNFIVTVVTPMWDLMWAVMSTSVETAWELIKTVVEVGWELIKGVFLFYKGVISAQWELIWGFLKGFFETWWKGIKSLVEGVFDIFRGIIKTFAGLVTGDWDKFWEGLKLLMNGVLGALEGVWNITIGPLITAIEGFITRIGGAWDSLWEGMEGAWGGFLGALTGVWNGAGKIIEAGLNGAIDIINWFIDKINWIPGINIPDIPQVKFTSVSNPQGTTGLGKEFNVRGATLLAKGGLIPAQEVSGGFLTAGARAIVGEGSKTHPEFVIPTDPMYRQRALSLTGQLLDSLGLAASRAYQSGGVLKPTPAYGIGGKIGGAISSITGSITGGIANVFDWAIPDWLSDAIGWVLDKAVDQAISWLRGRIRDLPGFGLPEMFQLHKGIPTYGLDQFERWVRGERTRIDSMVTEYNKKTTPTIPVRGPMAQGGIIRSPQFSLLGEDGPEVVIPLTKPNRAAELFAQSGLANTLTESNTTNNNIPVTINMNGSPSPAEVGHEAWWAIRSGVVA